MYTYELYDLYTWMYKINACFIEASRMCLLRIDCGICIINYSKIIVYKTSFYHNLHFYSSEEKFVSGYFYVINKISTCTFVLTSLYVN